ncbi:trehalose-phosphatase [Aquibium carbonis]|uniref:trehalose-phosphatase n=1 Tax=Aquibium carbonis TaxID=2495581 RepID=UPI0014792A0B|nr:trehalose-phosphatase [Aquibium carbonis]
MYDDLSTLAFPPSSTAFFFDFDGTLAEIVEDPRAVRIAPEVLEALSRLHRMSGGAVAVVSGREIDALDAFLSPLRLPLGGAHGSERRDPQGRRHQVEADRQSIERVVEQLNRFAASHEGLLVEAKRTSVALHYRRRPELERACRELARAVADTSGLSLLEGKMVAELKLSGRTKGDLVADFMAEAPFRGRRPVFFGDDVTDEDAFGALPRWDGVSVKIGGGPTIATHRMPDPAALHAWLRGMAGPPSGGTERAGSS